MKKLILFISIFIYSMQTFADCESEKEKSLQDCSSTNWESVKQIINSGQKTLEQKDAGAGTTAQKGIEDAKNGKTQADAANAKCAQSIQSCSKTCQQENQQKTSEQDYAGADRATQSRMVCENGEPKKNLEAGQKSSMDLGQMMQALAGLLAALGQQKGDEQKELDDCISKPDQEKCKQDVATAGAGATLSQGSLREGAGGGSFLDAGLAGGDMPTTGQGVAPSLSQGTPGMGTAGAGGAGVGAGGGSRGGGRNAEAAFDGSPKINLAGGSGGGGRGGGGSMGTSSSGKAGSGNPIATRGSLDADARAQQSLEKARENRGLASDGALGGITSAHSLDNFQKVEKCMQTQRNLLSEL